MATRKDKEMKDIDARVAHLYRVSCDRVQIPMMAIGKVFQVGRTAIAQGGTDEAVTAAIVAFVETVRTN
jgi:hypothetical protein